MPFLRACSRCFRSVYFELHVHVRSELWVCVRIRTNAIMIRGKKHARCMPKAVPLPVNQSLVAERTLEPEILVFFFQIWRHDPAEKQTLDLHVGYKRSARRCFDWPL